MSSDIHRLVREYLLVRVGKCCPRIDELLWWQVREKGLELDFKLSKTVAPCIVSKGMPDFGGSSETETDEGVLVEYRLNVREHRWYNWSILCQGGPKGEYVICCAQGTSITEHLAEVRGEFDARCAGPGARMEASMEAPTSAKEWRAFVELWLFGPPEPKQASLQKWLRPRA